MRSLVFLPVASSTSPQVAGSLAWLYLSCLILWSARVCTPSSQNGSVSAVLTPARPMRSICAPSAGAQVGPGVQGGGPVSGLTVSGATSTAATAMSGGGASGASASGAIASGAATSAGASATASDATASGAT